MSSRRPSPKRPPQRAAGSKRPPLLRWKDTPPAALEPDGVVRTRSALRMLWVGAGLGVAYLALLGRAAGLMLLPDPLLEAKAQVQFESAVEVQGHRGDILDRDGDILATTVEMVEVHADPAAIDPSQVAAYAATLAPLLAVPEAELAAKLAQSERRDVLLSRGLTPDKAMEARRAVPREALFLVEEPKRFYPGRSDAANLLGLVGHNGSGTAGIEQTYDHWLRGETFRYVQFRDRKGRQITPKVPNIQPGHTVVLTLDRQMQRLVEDAVDKGWERMHPLAMHAVVVDVHTGEILALANRPSLNPNDSSAIDMSAFKNRAALDAFEPGSVFKPFIAAAALEEKIVTPESHVDCEGGAWTVGRKTIRDDHPHGVVTVAEVIKYSSNIGAAKLAFQLGANRSISYLSAFGFGRYSGLGLPGETRGAMRSADDIKPIELATTAYGHGVSANTLQLAAAVATLGNDGKRMKPLLIKEIRDWHGEVVRRFEPELDAQVISPETARTTLAMMETVTEAGGTGTRARVPGYLVAGKTGTAWKHVDGGYSSTDRIGSFVGTLPVAAPEVAIVVVVDSPSEGSRYGGLTAAPVFSEIGAGAMRLLGVPPDPALLEEEKPSHSAELARESEAPPVPSAQSELLWTEDGGLRAPDLGGLSLRDALAALEGAGLTVRFRGSGRVFEQSPAPGSRLAPGDAVEVVLQ